MSKKTLLNETQIRRFMKLANVGTLTDGFVDGLTEAGYFTEEPIAEEEEELGGEEELALGGEEELPGDEGPVDDLGAEEEPALDDLGAEEPALDDAAGESLPPEVVSQVEDALAAALGAMEQELEAAIPELDLSVEQDAGGEEDLGAEEPALDDLGGEEEAPLDDLGAEEELVERIVSKVAARIRNTTAK